jgi:hypothetical protein
MKLHSDLPVYKSTYDLLLGIFEFTKSFSKEYKYTLGESLKKETIDLLIHSGARLRRVPTLIGRQIVAFATRH